MNKAVKVLQTAIMQSSNLKNLDKVITVFRDKNDSYQFDKDKKDDISYLSKVLKDINNDYYVVVPF